MIKKGRPRQAMTRGVAAIGAFGIVLGLGGAVSVQAEPIAYPSVSDQRLLNAQNDDGWLMYRRAYNSQGFAPFNQITPDNLGKLKEVFSYKTGLDQGHEAPPIVNGRFLFVSTPLNHVIAMDATSGKVLWTYVCRATIKVRVQRQSG